MKQMTGMFLIAVIGAMSTVSVHATEQHVAEDGMFYAEAEVTDVQPIVRVVRVTTPRRTCWDEPVRQTHHGYGRRPGSYTSTVLGGIIGGVVGNQFGSGSGNTAMTAAGALLGASVGRDAAMRRQGHPGYYSTMEQRCEVEEMVHEEERLDGYRVTYFYQGRSFVTRMAQDPGSRIRLRVQVDPLTYNDRVPMGY